MKKLSPFHIFVNFVVDGPEPSMLVSCYKLQRFSSPYWFVNDAGNEVIANWKKECLLSHCVWIGGEYNIRVFALTYFSQAFLESCLIVFSSLEQDPILFTTLQC